MDIARAGFASRGQQTLELRDGELAEIWQDFQLSGMPDLLGSLHLCHALHALAKSGLLDRLRSGPSSAESGLLDGVNHRVSSNVLRYLALKGVLEEWRGTYRLTRRGELLTSEIALARLGFYLEAYGPVVQRADELMTGQAVYGRDVHRSNGPLSRHCATIFARYYTPIVLETMRDRGARSVLDLGCGGGQLLVDACLSDPGLTGIGLDIAPAAVEVARELAREHGVEDRLHFEVADAFNPSSWPERCRGVDMITGIGVLHEHFRDGDKAVVDILNAYADHLGGEQMLLIGEPEPHYDDRESDSEFFLMHVLTDQGFPVDREKWSDIFTQTRLTCRRVVTWATAGPRMCFYDLEPRG
ncbi:class I SAM-dependent methyltransferase [Streptomyces sp. BRB081]|uniref:class I SAM-dependent methyltransferase n=1 Tax=Streptomyces sp. BRB081 TaxID=2769544 RepID=UPI0018ACCF37|nr:class I SAM-dependent methyltransferase [Streptomyces sp. BRB081]MBL3808361.1 methyltransferase domain-containing protein [Streptomyces sp. BRB081]